MTPEATEAIRALTQAVEGLRESVATQIPWPTWVLVAITAVYVWLTRTIARETKQAAQAAQESAMAARDSALAFQEMVALERQRQLEGNRPEITLHHYFPEMEGGALPTDHPAPSQINLRNDGRGSAIGSTLFLRFQTAAGDEAVRVPTPNRVIAPRDQPYVNPEISVKLHLAWTEAIVVCHYEEEPILGAKPRVFHSVCITMRASGDRRRGYFPPSLPLQDDPTYGQFFSLCESCSSVGQELVSCPEK